MATVVRAALLACAGALLLPRIDGGSSPVFLLAGAVALLELGAAWGRGFARHHAANGERAWTWWMLWPSLGALTATLALRTAAPAPAVAALAACAVATIVVHALCMGQRDQPVARGGTGAVPDGVLAAAVRWVPTGSATLVAAVLAVIGIVLALR